MSESLGAIEKDIRIAINPFLVALVWGILTLLAIAAIVLARMSPLAILAGVVGGIIEIAILIVAYRSRRDTTRVKIFDNGIVVTNPIAKQTILWDDVDGVQISQFADTLDELFTYRVPTMILPLPGLLIVKSRSQVGQRSRFVSRCDYVFHTNGEKHHVGSSDPRLLALMPLIKNRVMARLIPIAIEYFERGEDIPLAEGLAYSQTGIHGTFIRQVRRTKRQITVDLNWKKVKRIYFLADALRINGEDHDQVILPVSEIINLEAFMVVLTELA